MWACTYSMTWAFCWAVCISVSCLKIHTLILAAHLEKYKSVTYIAYSDPQCRFSAFKQLNVELFSWLFMMQSQNRKHINRMRRAFYLTKATFSPLIHLAIVFGVVFKERCLAVTDPDHAAIVWVVITVLAEKLPTKQISAKEERVKLCVHIQSQCIL